MGGGPSAPAGRPGGLVMKTIRVIAVLVTAYVQLGTSHAVRRVLA